jgi:hypothetical protein
MPESDAFLERPEYREIALYMYDGFEKYGSSDEIVRQLTIEAKKSTLLDSVHDEKRTIVLRLAISRALEFHDARNELRDTLQRTDVDWSAP